MAPMSAIPVTLAVIGATEIGAISANAAPADAPEDTPSTYGSAMGLRTTDCMTAPQTDSPAPVRTAIRMRGMRMLQTMR